MDFFSNPSNLHTGPHLWQIKRGGLDPLPMLKREACAQFYRDKNVARDRVLLNNFNNSGATKYMYTL